MDEKPRTTPYPLRMPDDLRAKLEASAKSGARSLHAEIVARLEQSLANEIVYFTDPEAQKISAHRMYEASLELAKDPEFKQELQQMMAAALVFAKLKKLTKENPDLGLSAADVLKDIKSLAAPEVSQEKSRLKKPADH